MRLAVSISRGPPCTGKEILPVAPLIFMPSNQVEPSDLATALKGVSEHVRETVVRNMSERAGMDLLDEIEVMGPVRLQAVEEAQAAVVRIIRRLEEEGAIVVRRGSEDEFVA